MRKYLGRTLMAIIAVSLFSVSYASAQTCAAAWNSATAYVGGSQVSRNCSGMKNFVAQYWTQGNDPCTNNGVLGTGEEWFVGTACGGATPTRTPTATARSRVTPTRTNTPTATSRVTPTRTNTPTATPTSGGGGCSAAWNSTTIYTAGPPPAQASKGGRNYQAAYWNQNMDPTISGNACPSGCAWKPWTFCGGGDTGSGEILNVVNKTQFDQIFPSRNSFYTFTGFTNAANSIPAFAGPAFPINTRKREVASAFANFTQETSGLWYITEISQSQCPTYCDFSTPPACDPVAGQAYYGRGPIQLSWNFNYCAAGTYLGLNLLGNPNLVQQDPAVAWKTAIWYWMTQTGPAVNNNFGAWPLESAHDAITTTDGSGNYGFAGTIRSINGALECFSGQQQQHNRVIYYNGSGNEGDEDSSGGILGILGYTGGTFGRRHCG